MSIFFFSYCRKFFDNQSIILHGRNVQTLKRQAFFIQDFYPRIGVENTEKNAKKVIDLEKKGIILKKDFFYKDDVNRPFYDQFDRYVIVIYLKSTNDVYTVRPQFDVTHQDDVPYESVFKIDRNIHTGFFIKNFAEIDKQKRILLPGKENSKYAELFKCYLRVSYHDITGF